MFFIWTERNYPLCDSVTFYIELLNPFQNFSSTFGKNKSSVTSYFVTLSAKIRLILGNNKAAFSTESHIYCLFNSSGPKHINQKVNEHLEIIILFQRVIRLM